MCDVFRTLILSSWARNHQHDASFFSNEEIDDFHISKTNSLIEDFINRLYNMGILVTTLSINPRPSSALALKLLCLIMRSWVDTVDDHQNAHDEVIIFNYFKTSNHCTISHNPSLLHPDPDQLSHDKRKLGLGISDQVKHKLACTATEEG